MQAPLTPGVQFALRGSVVHRFNAILTSAPGPAPARGVLTTHPQRTMSAFQTRQPALTVVQSRSRSRSKSRNRDRSRIAASSYGTQLLIELQTATCTRQESTVVALLCGSSCVSVQRCSRFCSCSWSADQPSAANHVRVSDPAASVDGSAVPEQEQKQE